MNDEKVVTQTLEEMAHQGGGAKKCKGPGGEDEHESEEQKGSQGDWNGVVKAEQGARGEEREARTS